VDQIFVLLFFDGKSYVLILAKTGWAIFGWLFSRAHPVTLNEVEKNGIESNPRTSSFTTFRWVWSQHRSRSEKHVKIPAPHQSCQLLVLKTSAILLFQSLKFFLTENRNKINPENVWEWAWVLHF
jgi:hypothetical protein